MKTIIKKQKPYSKEYYDKNKDKYKKSHKKYYEKNRDKYKSYNKKYYIENHDILLKNLRTKRQEKKKKEYDQKASFLMEKFNIDTSNDTKYKITKLFNKKLIEYIENNSPIPELTIENKEVRKIVDNIIDSVIDQIGDIILN